MTENEMLTMLYTDREKGIGIIYEKYAGLAYKIVLQKLRSVCSKEDIEETVSDVFVEIYENADKINADSGSLTAFIVTVAQRKAIDAYRKRVRQIGKDTCIEKIPEQPANDNTEQTVLDKLQREALFNAVLALGEPDRTIITRRFFLCETCKEIGSHLNMTGNAVNKRLKRSLEKLKKIMEGTYTDG